MVTGAGSGIGLAIADRLLTAGASVVVHHHSSVDGARSLAVKHGQERCLLVQADFAVPASTSEVFAKAWGWHRRLEILVNNAATIVPVASIDQITEEDLVRTMQVNHVAPFMLSKLSLSAMRHQRDGRIVSISSIGVKFLGSAQTTPYMVSKAALEAGTLALARFAAADGVLINVVRAGVTRTALHARIGRPDLGAREAQIPLRRAAEPDEIAAVVEFLVSPSNTYLTGALIPVAGGE